MYVIFDCRRNQDEPGCQLWEDCLHFLLYLWVRTRCPGVGGDGGRWKFNMPIVLFFFSAILYICHRRNVQHTKKYLAEAKLRQVHTTENGKVEILLNETK